MPKAGGDRLSRRNQRLIGIAHIEVAGPVAPGLDHKPVPVVIGGGVKVDQAAAAPGLPPTVQKSINGDAEQRDLDLGLDYHERRRPFLPESDPVMADHESYGFQRCVSKPFRLQDLAEAVADIAAHGRHPGMPEAH